MTGKGNPNFGVERTDEHSTAISIGQRKAKLASRKITDAEIDAIQAARAQGTKIQDIADKFGYSRGYISDICRGKVLLSTEQLDQAKIDANIVARKIKRAEGPLSEEEINKRNSIARRKITPSQVIGIIKARRANAELSFRMLGEMFGGMAINQARNAFVGVTKLFESEFPIDGVTWEEYQGWF
jgi:transcriptional regulator with XRE-family HTH domain